MHNSTLCYITRGNDVLMLHRVKKKNDVNQDKWIGIGGKFEEDETPDECLLREAQEETGLTLTSWKCRGVVTFLTNGPYDGEYMYLFTADGFEGELKECDEGDLQWISREFLDQLPKWEGDQIFLDLLWQDAPFFLLKLRYQGSTLVEAVLNGEKIRVYADPAMPWTLDGEREDGHSMVDVLNVHHAIRLMQKVKKDA